MDDEDIRESEDDALEDTRPHDTFHPDRDEEQLPNDDKPPAAPDPTNRHHIPPSHPVTDTDIDRDELYGEGLGEATDVDNREEDSDDEPAKPLEPEDEE